MIVGQAGNHSFTEGKLPVYVMFCRAHFLSVPMIVGHLRLYLTWMTHDRRNPGNRGRRNGDERGKWSALEEPFPRLTHDHGRRTKEPPTPASRRQSEPLTTEGAPTCAGEVCRLDA